MRTGTNRWFSTSDKPSLNFRGRTAQSPPGQRECPGGCGGMNHGFQDFTDGDRSGARAAGQAVTGYMFNGNELRQPSAAERQPRSQNHVGQNHAGKPPPVIVCWKADRASSGPLRSFQTAGRTSDSAERRHFRVKRGVPSCVSNPHVLPAIFLPACRVAALTAPPAQAEEWQVKNHHSADQPPPRAL